MGLVHFNKARQELAIAKSIDEVKSIRDKAEALRAYAKQVGESLEMQNHIAEIKIRAERKAGELLKENKRDKGETDKKIMSDDVTLSGKAKLEDIGISRNQSSDWQKIADIPEEKFEKHLGETKDRKEELTTASVLRLAEEIKDKPHIAYNSGNNEWYTPSEIVESARLIMGSIDLDPASSELANTVVKAFAFYTIEDSGLEKEWHGNVFMNPPYSSDLIFLFVDKLISEYDNNNVNEAIVLVNNATETKWFQSLIKMAYAICFTSGRIKYWCPEGTFGAPLQGQAIVYIGNDPIGFRNEFSKHGWVAFPDLNKLFPENTDV